MIFSKGNKPGELKNNADKQLSEYENALFGQKERIFSMREENRRLTEELENYKKRDKQISGALMLAMQKAKEIEDNARAAAELELERLKEFHNKWVRYYEDVRRMFPEDTRVAAAGELLARMEVVLSRGADGNFSAVSAAERELMSHHSAESRRLELLKSEESQPGGSEDSGDAVAASEAWADETAQPAAKNLPSESGRSHLQTGVLSEQTAHAQTVSAQTARAQTVSAQPVQNFQTAQQPVYRQSEQSQPPAQYQAKTEFEGRLGQMKQFLDRQEDEFSMDEVLNPKNLASLDELCDEMGLK